MNRSKLQICTEILCYLAFNGPINLTCLSERLNIKEVQLNQHLKLLKVSDLITKQNFGKNSIFFSITDSGLATLKINHPIFSESQRSQIKNFERVVISL